MAPKKNAKTTSEAAIPMQEVDNRDTRSGYGDNHAATEDAMMLAHAKQLRRDGVIDDHMEAELSKPRRHSSEVNVKYSAEYLSMHPEYTGQNRHEMPTLDTALKHQKARDEAERKQLEDYQAGRIDEWGNRIGRQNGPSSSQTFGGNQNEPNDGYDEPSKNQNEMRHMDGSTCLPDNTPSNATIVPAVDSSGESVQPSTASEGSNDREHTNQVQPTGVEKVGSPKKPETPISNSVKPPTNSTDLQAALFFLPATPSLHPQIHPTSAPATKRLTKNTPTTTNAPAAITISSSSSQSSSSSRSPKKKKRKVTPLIPLPGYPDYTDLDYYTVLDLCRDRKLPRGGNEYEVRNTLIQDDMNIAQGKERERAKSSNNRREYKHRAPEELKNRVENAPSVAKGGGNGERAGVAGRRVVKAGGKGEGRRETGVLRDESEVALEDVKGMRGMKRKAKAEADGDGEGTQEG